MYVVDLADVPHEDDALSDNDLRAQLALIEELKRKEEKRLNKLLSGCGRGGGKSTEFEFAARTILATGCSARAAREKPHA